MHTTNNPGRAAIGRAARLRLVSPALMLAMLVGLLRLQAGLGAPAPPHLAVGAALEGDVPTLVVTSAEVGITPELLLAPPQATAGRVEGQPPATPSSDTYGPSTAAPAPAKVQKAGKGKGHKSPYAKKHGTHNSSNGSGNRAKAATTASAGGFSTTTATPLHVQKSTNAASDATTATTASPPTSIQLAGPQNAAATTTAVDGTDVAEATTPRTGATSRSSSGGTSNEHETSSTIDMATTPTTPATTRAANMTVHDDATTVTEQGEQQADKFPVATVASEHLQTPAATTITTTTTKVTETTPTTTFTVTLAPPTAAAAITSTTTTTSTSLAASSTLGQTTPWALGNDGSSSDVEILAASTTTTTTIISKAVTGTAATEQQQQRAAKTSASNGSHEHKSTSSLEGAEDVPPTSTISAPVRAATTATAAGTTEAAAATFTPLFKEATAMPAAYKNAKRIEPRDNARATTGGDDDYAATAVRSDQQHRPEQQQQQQQAGTATRTATESPPTTQQAQRDEPTAESPHFVERVEGQRQRLDLPKRTTMTAATEAPAVAATTIAMAIASSSRAGSTSSSTATTAEPTSTNSRANIVELATTTAPTTTSREPATATGIPATTSQTVTTTIGEVTTPTITTPTTTQAPPTSTSTKAAATKLADINVEAAIKLMDLEEQQHAAATAARVQQQPLQAAKTATKDQSSNSDRDTVGDANDGHDGVKRTKKKQLDVAAHFAPNLPAVPSATTHAPLLPVHNGYLGPIIMAEKTFSHIVHAGGGSNHQKALTGAAVQHAAPIESQLRAGRLVEIIAPVVAATTGTTTSTTTTVMPIPPVERQQQASGRAAAPVLSTTVFQVADGGAATHTSTTRLPVNSRRANAGSEGVKTESKISDIQIEVYDSTVDSIVASTNFKDNNAAYYAPLLDMEMAMAEEHAAPSAALVTPRPPTGGAAQERFTQYVVDRIDSSTQRTLSSVNGGVGGRPEPAAIEIHINVSEAVGGADVEDLEFAYAPRNVKPTLIDVDGGNSISNSNNNNNNNNGNKKGGSASSEHNDEILVVEIIDTGDAANSTESSASVENVNPIFTFHADSYAAPAPLVAAAPNSDELFLADVKRDGLMLAAADGDPYPRPPLPPPPPPPRKPTSVDRDSDTIFYISNTEVKVSELLPTPPPQPASERQLSQFFPASTEPPSAAASIPRRYEEDIILSSLPNGNADALKIYRSQGDGAPPLDVTYVGESIVEAEQAAPEPESEPEQEQRSSSSTATPAMTDIIIQPATLPEMSIGVPVIGELPPQIELKEIDFIPDETNGLYGTSDLELEERGGNDVDSDRLVESSIQYGGDLIDEGARGGFDGVEGSYPFGNPAAVAHYSVNHGVSHLRKDELSVDVMMPATVDNGTLLSNKTRGGANDTLLAAAVAVAAERMSNATAFSVMEEQQRRSTLDQQLGFANVFSLIIGLFVVLLPIVVTVAMACGLRYLYGKYRANANHDSDTPDGAAAEAGGGGKTANVKSGNGIDASVTADSRENGTAGEECDMHQSSTLNEPNINKDSRQNPRQQQLQNDQTSDTKPSNGATLSLQLIDESQQQQHTVQQQQSSTALFTHSAIPTTTTTTPSGPNGSVTKMTLKNNHLIVETEERNDISRDARETKMHYNTADKDGVFVVEVSRGVDSKATIPDSPVVESCEQRLPMLEAAVSATTTTLPKQLADDGLQRKEEVQIHPPPPEVPAAAAAAASAVTEESTQRSLHLIEEVEEEPQASSVLSANAAEQVAAESPLRANTGLSQSDLSSTSSTDSNKRYSYGNQELYVVEPCDYACTAAPPALTSALGTPDAAQDDDRKSQNGHSLEHSPSTAAPPPAAQDAKIAESTPAAQAPPPQTPTATPTPAPPDVAFSTLTQNAAVQPQEQPDIDSEQNYDSLMSLPAPPSTEEIKQLAINGIAADEDADIATLCDINQLDSLPPPPPADEATHTLVAPPEPLNAATMPLTPVEPESPAHCNGEHAALPSPPPPPLVNGHTVTAALPPPPTSTPLEVSANGKLLPAPLTPPASPPPSPPAHFSNGSGAGSGASGNGTTCQPLRAATVPHAVAVDVNGS